MLWYPLGVIIILNDANGKLLISKYSPDVYKVVETPEPVGEHKDFMKDRYMLLDGNDKFVLQEIKLNDPNKKRSAKLFFGSELLRVGENNNDNMIIMIIWIIMIICIIMIVNMHNNDR